MKIKFFKMILPVAVITIGMASAVSTNAMSKTAAAFANRTGYTHLEGENCVITNMTCKNTSGVPCTFGGNQLYDLNSVTNTCPNPLNKI